MALVTILVVTAVAMILASSAAILGMGELQISFSHKQSLEALVLADACLDEAFIRLRRDSAYIGGSLNIGDNSCTITVVPLGDSRTVVVQGNVNNVIKKVEAEIDVSAPYLQLNYRREAE